MKENKYFRVIRTAKPGTNWPNGVDGRFIDIDDDGRYRFVPSTIGDWWDQDLSVITTHFYDLKEDEQYTSIIRKLPVVAWGLLQQYIRWEVEKNLKDIYSEYYGRCFEVWKSNVRYDIELMRKSSNEIEAAFIRVMIEDESYRVEESSKRLFPYLPEDEQRILKQVGDGFIAYLHERLKELEPQQEIPEELNSDKAKVIFDRAEQAGLISKNGQQYRWNKSTVNTYQLLAYFCEKMSQYLNLNNRIKNKEGEPMTSWKPFEKLFGVEKLIRYKNDWLKVNTKFTPNGYERIDLLFS
jgi:hypothetical protein